MQHEFGLTENVSNYEKDVAPKIIGDEDVIFVSNLDGSFNGRNWVFIPNIGDISPTFEKSSKVFLYLSR